MLTFFKKLIALGRRDARDARASLSAVFPEPGDTSLVPLKERRDQDEILLFLVDLVDEMDALPQASTGGREELALVRSRIVDRLLLSDAEMIRDETWNPERQRAVAVSGNALVGGIPRIGYSRASGLCVAGRIVRKQEVFLEES